MTYHFNGIDPDWIFDGAGVLGYDIPILLADEYTQSITLATAALAIGYHIGTAEAERKHKKSAAKNR